jgi:hypothetical protein
MMIASSPYRVEVTKEVTRREFLLQGGTACVGLTLRRGPFAAESALQPDQPAGAGSDAGAGVRLPRRRQRRQQHVVPTTTTEIRCACRGTEPSGLGIPRDSLLPITPLGIGSVRAASGLPGAGAVDRQKLSVVCNVSPLVRP